MSDFYSKKFGQITGVTHSIRNFALVDIMKTNENYENVGDFFMNRKAGVTFVTKVVCFMFSVCYVILQYYLEFLLVSNKSYKIASNSYG